MTHSNDQKNTGRNEGSAEEMQRANAMGDHQNDQGQSAFATGSTTGGGSNFGQGSSHLGGESYRQGHETNAGANYGNEADRLGASSTGTSNEGASGEAKGAAASGYEDSQNEPASPRNDDGSPLPQDNRGKDERATAPEEGDRRDTERERNSGLGHSDANNDGRQSGSWSRATTDE